MRLEFSAAEYSSGGSTRTKMMCGSRCDVRPGQQSVHQAGDDQQCRRRCPDPVGHETGCDDEDDTGEGQPDDGVQAHAR